MHGTRVGPLPLLGPSALSPRAALPSARGPVALLAPPATSEIAAPRRTTERAPPPPPAAPGAPRLGAREAVLALAVSLVLGSLSTFEYVKVSYEKCFHEFPAWHRAHMANQAAAPLQYRVLSYLIPEALHRLGVPIAVAYIAERGVFLVAAGVVFFRFCRIWMGTVDAVSSLTLLMFFYTLSAFPHIQPSEEINLFAFALGLLAIRTRRFGLLFTTVTVAALNKETIGFLIPLYLLWEWRTKGPSAPLWLRAGLLSSALALVYVGIRLLLGVDRPYLAGLWQARHNLALLGENPFLGLIFLIPSLGPAIWILRRRRRIDPFFVAFLPSLFLFVAGHFAISRVDEFRTYAPLALVTIPASMLLFRDSIREWSRHPG